MKKLSPDEIERESMRIIDREAGTHCFKADEWKVVRRIIHATADFEFMNTIRFHQDSIACGIRAIRSGCPVYTDTKMLSAAVNNEIKKIWGCEVYCFISDDDVRKKSEETGLTRSVIAIRKAAPFLSGGIILIGNAPTALHEAISLYEKGIMKPDLIIGMPVGFVEALESKDRLCKTNFTYITNISRKGGTPATAAAINALIKIAGEKK
jgi:precorrin-8X/cobalt-precorrin-8 methylmutase